MSEITNTDQYDAWNADSGRRWLADPDRRDRVIAEVADVLLAAADLRPGERVLDVGCGCGATTLAAARAVGPGGSVVGVDLAAAMLDVARRRAVAAALHHIELVQADAQTHAFGGGFDVAVSRFGTMFFADPVAAFANIAGALRPGGRLCFVTWQAPVANDWLMIPGAALRSFGSRPEAADHSGTFAQSDPSVIESTLTAAGFIEVHVEPVAVTVHLGDDPTAAAVQLAGTGTGRAALEVVPEADRPRAFAAVEAVLAAHATADGVRLGGAVLVTSAATPSA